MSNTASLNRMSSVYLMTRDRFTDEGKKAMIKLYNEGRLTMKAGL